MTMMEANFPAPRDPETLRSIPVAGSIESVVRIDNVRELLLELAGTITDELEDVMEEVPVSARVKVAGAEEAVMDAIARLREASAMLRGTR